MTHKWGLDSEGFLAMDLYTVANDEMIEPVHILQHVVVVEAMQGSPLDRNQTVIHINGIRTDNRPENLKIVNQGIDYPDEESLPQPKGRNGFLPILTPDSVADIRRLHEGGSSASELAFDFDVSRTTISNVINRKGAYKDG